MGFCQPYLSWCSFGNILARRSLREMLGYRGRIRNEPLAHAYRQIVDKRIDGGPRLVPPNDWPDVRAPPPNLWDDYNEDAVGGESPLGVPESPRHPIRHDLCWQAQLASGHVDPSSGPR